MSLIKLGSIKNQYSARLNLINNTTPNLWSTLQSLNKTIKPYKPKDDEGWAQSPTIISIILGRKLTLKKIFLLRPPIIMSRAKHSICYNISIMTHDLHVRPYNKIFHLGDESESEMKVPCTPIKSTWFYIIPSLNPTHVLVRALLPTQRH